MSEQTRANLKAYFNYGDYPNESMFGDLIDSVINIQDDLAALVVAAAGSTQDLDLDLYYAFDITLDQNCSLSFSNPRSSGLVSKFYLILRQDGAGSHTVTWPGSVIWPAGSPGLGTGSNNISLVEFITLDGGVTWLGSVMGDAYA